MCALLEIEYREYEGSLRNTKCGLIILCVTKLNLSLKEKWSFICTGACPALTVCTHKRSEFELFQYISSGGIVQSIIGQSCCQST